MKVFKIFFFVTTFFTFSAISAATPTSTMNFFSAQTPVTSPAMKSNQMGEVANEMESDPSVALAQTQFALRLFQNVYKEHSKENLLVSPLSVNAALNMVYNGARGKTQEEMVQVLGLDSASLEKVNRENASIYKALENLGPHTHLNIENSIWADKRVVLKKEFLEVNKKYYGATMENLDFSESKAPQIVNQWVSDKTNGKIPTIVDSFKPDEVLLLLNAIYFKGLWKDPFLKKNTTPEPFYLADGNFSEVPTMHRTARTIGATPYYLYQQTELFQAVCLPYIDERLRLMIFLPAKGKSLGDFCAGLNPDAWNEWMGKFSSAKVNLCLPKFKLEFTIGLIPSLTSLGMGSAFSNFADFSGISGARLKISKAIQKTFMEVNEEGTEAAAATAIGFEFYAVEEVFQMQINRPFFFALYDQQSKTILFAGTMLDPRK